MNETDIERLRLWVAGYRVLMQGGLDEKVHHAGTSVSMLPDDTPAYLTVGDVEYLLDHFVRVEATR